MTCSGNDDGPGDDDNEFDVDMTPGDEVVLEAGVDYLGAYPDLASYLRGQVEHLLVRDGLWLLECIDLERVHRALEGDAYEIWHADNCVYRRRLTSGPAAG